MMKRYLKFALISLSWIILFALAAFCDCKNFPISIHALPDGLIGISLVLYSFVLAGVGIAAILNYFNAVKNSPTASAISRSKAMAFLLGFALCLTTIIELSRDYCR